MPKTTRSTNKPDCQNNQLTPADAQEIYALLQSILEAFSGANITAADKRYLKRVAGIAAKIRRLY